MPLFIRMKVCKIYTNVDYGSGNGKIPIGWHTVFDVLEKFAMVLFQPSHLKRRKKESVFSTVGRPIVMFLLYRSANAPSGHSIQIGAYKMG